MGIVGFILIAVGAAGIIQLFMYLVCTRIEPKVYKLEYLNYDELIELYQGIDILQSVDEFDLYHRHLESNPHITKNEANELRNLLGSKLKNS